MRGLCDVIVVRLKYAGQRPEIVLFNSLQHHARITGALFMREIMTRYGREGIGFLWLIGEPLLFCMGVIGMWTLIKPAYEHGVRIAPFVMTGYMCLILFRHIVNHNMSALQANAGLMYHRRVRSLHVFVSRTLLEWAGSTVAFFMVYVILMALGLVRPPSDFLLLYAGWTILAMLSMGFSIIFAALSIMFDVMERVVPVFMYLMIPFSGAFIMIDWLPSKYREYYLLIPMPHTVEMVRASVFGEFIPTHYSLLYPTAWAIGTIVFGLLLLSVAYKHLEVE